MRRPHRILLVLTSSAIPSPIPFGQPLARFFHAIAKVADAQTLRRDKVSKKVLPLTHSPKKMWRGLRNFLTEVQLSQLSEASAIAHGTAQDGMEDTMIAELDYLINAAITRAVNKRLTEEKERLEKENVELIERLKKAEEDVAVAKKTAIEEYKQSAEYKECFHYVLGVDVSVVHGT